MLSYLSLLFFGTLHANGYIFPFLLYFSRFPCSDNINSLKDLVGLSESHSPTHSQAPNKTVAAENWLNYQNKINIYFQVVFKTTS